jgi:DNA topoisomerase-1
MSSGTALIVTEKDNAARRIAEILSDDSATTDQVGGVNIYTWGGNRVIGLSGHVVGVDFPPEYNSWRDVEPIELIDAPIEKHPTQTQIVSALRRLAGEARQVTIATDYDREGELIGKEAYELVRDVNDDVPVDRVRFSSITDREVTEAFNSPDDIDFDLAAAGEARQIIDLIWGAALTRYLSLSASQLGEDFISVGRVQGPTLKLIVDREREIEAFEPDTYWELFADLSTESERESDSVFEAQYFYLDDEKNEAERVWDEASAEAAFETIQTEETATVVSVTRRQQSDTPPSPFNTTQYIRAASSQGYSAQRAMSLAETLYTAGYITYPRTDNTVYPDDLDPETLLESLAEGQEFGDDAASLLEADEMTLTSGDEETTDHPPIHPTGELPTAAELSDDEWEIYELVVRRFLATVADPAVWERLRVVVDIDTDVALKANGKRMLESGYHDVYPYFETNESIIPNVTEGETLSITDEQIEEKQTQPPRRYGQSRLIETMEKQGLGTKATRHTTIEKLYDRDYIERDPPRPTQLAQAVVEASERFADRIVSDEMTAQLEADMQAIAQGEISLSEVTNESRKMLTSVFKNLMKADADIGEHLRKSLKDDKTAGECPDCGDGLVVRESRQGSYFLGCDGYPDCEYTLPLPSVGKPSVLSKTCAEHGLHEIKMLAGRKTFIHGCPLCQAEAADAQDDITIGACPECGNTHDGELAIKQLRSGSKLVGCVRYPDCEYSLPLPRQGAISVTDGQCSEHDLPELQIVYEEADREPWELGCPICNYREYQAEKADSGSDLETVDGIGEKNAEKLKDIGVDSVTALKAAEPDRLASEVDGVGLKTIQKWQASAN